MTLPKGDAAWRHLLLDKGAPSAGVPRKMLNEIASELEDDYAARLASELPMLDYDAAGAGPDDDMDPAAAWAPLEEMHSHLVEKARDFASKRGSAEWLWWLRRLRGQFHVNSLESTEPYVQHLAEALATGEARPSTPIPNVPTFTFPLDAEVLLDLIWMRHASIQLYRVQATMKRCAKGQAVRFLRGEVPYAVPDNVIESAIEQFDQRALGVSGSLLDSVGLHLSPDMRTVPEVTGDTFGAVIPTWHHMPTKRPSANHRVVNPSDPAPAVPTFLDLRPLSPFAITQALAPEHVALIALLWAAWNIATREEDRMRRRLTAPYQWGYMVTPTKNFLLAALHETVEWMQHHTAGILPVLNIPAGGAAVLDCLARLEPSYWPPLAGNPVHQAGEHSVVDLCGASHRLVETLARPVDGAGVNFWSDQFEADVQGIIDRSSWRPTGEQRDLIGRDVRRSDGSLITNIDALAVRGDDVLLLSCKSLAHTPELIGGGHRAVRNAREKLELAAAEWDDKIAEIRQSRGRLPSWIVDRRLHGLVVEPSVPYIVDYRWRSPRPPLGLPAVVASSELEQALSAGA